MASAFICAICEHSPREEWDPRIAALGAGRVSSLADFMLRLIPEVESAAGRPVASANRWIDRIVLHLHFVGEPSEPVEQAEPMVLRGFASWQAQVDDSKAGAASAPGITEEDLDALIPLEDRNLAKTSVPAFVKWARAAFANPHAVARGMRWSDDGDEQFIPDAKSYPHIHIVDGRAVWSGKADSGRPRIVHGDNIVASSDSMRQFYEETDDLSIRIALHYLNFEAARAWSAELAEA